MTEMSMTMRRLAYVFVGYMAVSGAAVLAAVVVGVTLRQDPVGQVFLSCAIGLALVNFAVTAVVARILMRDASRRRGQTDTQAE